jgi:hypothetical protein
MVEVRPLLESLNMEHAQLLDDYRPIGRQRPEQPVKRQRGTVCRTKQVVVVGSEGMNSIWVRSLPDPMYLSLKIGPLYGMIYY